MEPVMNHQAALYAHRVYVEKNQHRLFVGSRLLFAAMAIIIKLHNYDHMQNDARLNHAIAPQF
jgi:hypothetical protein